jgi:putative ABC transport system permease protein
MRSTFRRLTYWLARQRHADDLREELASHQALKEEELRRQGVPEAELVAGARRALGSTALVQDRVHDVWTWPWLHDVARDLRLALRLMGTHRSFTAAIVTVLGIGIGVSSLQFTLIDAICVRGLPIGRVDRVLFLGARDARQREVALTSQEYDHLRDRGAGLEMLSAFSSAPGVVGDDERAPDRVLVTYASARLFDVLREQPQLGRGFQATDDVVGAPPVAVLAATYWASRYDSDPSIVGQQIRVNGTPTTIVGVMKAPFRFPAVTDVWQPLAAMPRLTTTGRTARLLSVIGRMADDGSLPAVRTTLASTSAEIRRDLTSSRDLTLTAVPINARYNGRLTDPVWLAFGGIAVVILLSACANAANLLLMRGVQRGHEIGVRASIGASRSRLVRQLLVEGAALALVSGVCGALLAALALASANRVIPENTLAYWMRFTLDVRALVLVLSVSLISVLLCGLVPALHLARAEVQTLLRSGGPVGFGRRRGRWAMTAFLTAQCALTMVVLAALALGVRSTREIGRQFVAIDPTNLLTTSVTLPGDRYATDSSRRAFFDRLEQQVIGLLQVADVAIATAPPLGGASVRHLLLDSAPLTDGTGPPTVWTVGISRSYFETLGIAVVKGHAFDARAAGDRDASVVVNQRFTELFLQGRDPLGQRLRLVDPSTPGAIGPTMEIVGVVPTVRQRPQSAEADPLVYLPLGPTPPASAVVLIRTSASPSSLVAPVRSLVRTLDPELPLYRTRPLEEALDAAQWNGRISDALLNGIAMAGVILGGIGLYAVLAHAAVSRRRELAIRIALGAHRTQLVGMVAQDAARYLLLGIVAGVGCVYAFATVTGTRADRMSIVDPTVLMAAGGVLTLVTLLASLGPAVRAIQADPARALREV